MRSCNPQGVLPSDITALAVGSYPTFSPIPARQSRHRRLFSFTLLHPHGHRAVNSCGALCCSDFPLPDSQAAIERTCKFLFHDAAVRFTLWLCHSLHLFLLRYELCFHDATARFTIRHCHSLHLFFLMYISLHLLKSYNLSYFTPPQGWCFLLAARQSV